MKYGRRRMGQGGQDMVGPQVPGAPQPPAACYPPFGSNRNEPCVERPHACRDYYLALENVAVPPAVATPITARVQRPFVPEELIISGVTAAGFRVQNIEVGTIPQRAATSGNVSATVWGPGSLRARLDCDFCDVGTDITITVINDTGAPLPFNAAFLGPASSANP